ncbi:MAG: transcription-repair coupling factor [Myxococcota bacterium]
MSEVQLPSDNETLPRAGAEGVDPLERLTNALSHSRRVRTQGLKGAARGYVLSRLSKRLKAPLVCITADEDQADQLAADLAFFLGGEGTPLSPRVLRLPADEALPYDELSPTPAVVTERLGALFHLRQGTPFPALVLSARALHRKVLPPKVMNDLSELLGKGQEHGRDALARKLVEMGYLSSPLVEDVGTFSVRGDIVDVFPPLHERPVRLELFGDTIESMRVFDPQTQRTVDALDELYLLPARELLLTPLTRAAAEAAARAAAERVDVPSSKVRERIEQIREGLPSYGLEALLPGFFEGGLASVFDYLPFWSKEPLVYVDDPVAVERTVGELVSDLERSFADAEGRQDLALPPPAHFLFPDEVRARLAPLRVVEGGGLALSSDFAQSPPVHFSFGSTQELRRDILSHHGEEGALTPLVERLSRWRDARIAAAIACGSLGQADRLKRLLLDRNVMVKVRPEPLEDPSRLYDPSVFAHLFTHEVSQGFVDGASGFAVVSDEEIFGARARRKTGRRRAESPFTAGFRDLKEGDLVVHTDFGIARYTGLTKMQVRGVPGDFLVLEYAGKDKVYLPVSRMRLIQKFSGGDPSKVALDRLGSGSWERTKKRVKEKLLQMAAELIQLYAARKAHPGTAFSEPDRYFRQFEADFEFEETADQQKAIDDVLADMHKPEPMDRLVCGDVGYGKTEVAMRAAFKAVLDKKQVAVLVPTTVLAQQHFLTFQRRFQDYPVKVEVVSRMRKPAEVREALARAKEGKVDVLIGTHKLLSSEVAFKDLGLLVVDEEQRFGVKHKEQLKRLRTQVDVLTLTATPIPRTLNMSLFGIRDMSIIATPPADRRAIRTFVLKFDPAQIREAIVRELQRGGQVFFVHNRVSSIHSMERFLKELVPEAKIAVAHGQMAEGQLEKVMVEFVEKKHHVLLCTAIIESGIDIPSANTMIVNRADAFGLAQLYQLRGRVGRSHERAYAYLLVPARRTITRDAQRRLEVLQAFTELGAGFSIASHDMEIRGAGNLLGPDQSGSIEAIGFDLYAQLLDEAVREMRGEPPKTEVEPEVTLPLPAFIPDDYVPDVHQRLMLYKRFSVAATPDELTDLRSELVDRFGEAPDEVDNLSELMALKIDMRDLRLRALEAGPGRLVVTLGPDAALDPLKLAALVQRSKGVYRLTPEMKLLAKVPEGQNLVAEAKKVLRELAGATVIG